MELLSPRFVVCPFWVRLWLYFIPPPSPDKPGGLAINDKLFRFNCPSGNISEVLKKHKEERGGSFESEVPETDLNILVNGENGHRINPTVTWFLRQQKVSNLQFQVDLLVAYLPHL